MKRSLVMSVLVAAGYLVMTWPKSNLTRSLPKTTLPAKVAFRSGKRGHGPTAADRSAAKYWRNHPAERKRQKAMPIAVTPLAELNHPHLGDSLSVAVPAGGVAQGARVVVVFSLPHTPSAVSCADARANTYAVDADVSHERAQRLVILSAPITSALQECDPITVTCPQAGNRCMSVAVISGLQGGGSLDQFCTATGDNGLPTSGSILTTGANAALIGAAARRDEPFLNAFAVGAHWSVLTPSPNHSGLLLQPGYRVVNATGTYAAEFNLDPAMEWAAALVSYEGSSSL